MAQTTTADLQKTIDPNGTYEQAKQMALGSNRAVREQGRQMLMAFLSDEGKKQFGMMQQTGNWMSGGQGTIFNNQTGESKQLYDPKDMLDYKEALRSGRAVKGGNGQGGAKIARVITDANGNQIGYDAYGNVVKDFGQGKKGGADSGMINQIAQRAGALVGNFLRNYKEGNVGIATKLSNLAGGAGEPFKNAAAHAGGTSNVDIQARADQVNGQFRNLAMQMVRASGQSGLNTQFEVESAASQVPTLDISSKENVDASINRMADYFSAISVTSNVDAGAVFMQAVNASAGSAPNNPAPAPAAQQTAPNAPAVQTNGVPTALAKPGSSKVISFADLKAQGY